MDELNPDTGFKGFPGSFNAAEMYSHEMKVEDDFEYNPWSVEDVSVFLKYCCPECDYQILDYDMFANHAEKNHTKSVTLFGPKEVTKSLIVKKEKMDYDYDNIEPSPIEPLPEADDDCEVKPSVVVPLQCDFCDFTCTTNNDMYQHYSKHQDAKPPALLLRCQFCDYSHGNVGDVELHSMEKHHKHFVCPTCGKILEKDETLLLHCRETKFKCKLTKTTPICKICNKEFLKWSLLKKHKLKMHEEEILVEILPCELCKFESKSKEVLKVHRLQNHQDGKHLCCPYCDFKRMSMDKLKYHIDKKHPQHGEKKRQCDVCQKLFIFQGSVKLHKYLQHVSDKRVCKICNLHFSTQKKLQLHNRNLHKKKRPRLDKVICEICFLDCKTNKELKEHHLKKHMSGKMKICSYCDKPYEEWHTLKLHIESKHPEHGEKKNICTICGKGFIFVESCKIHEGKHEKLPCQFCGRQMNSKYALRDHLSSIHNFESNQHVCEICGYSTLSKKQIGKHKREKHNPKNQQKCPYCDYQSPKLNMVQVHIDSKHPNHEKKTFFCDHCSRSFIFAASLKKHHENIKTMERERAKKGIIAKNLA